MLIHASGRRSRAVVHSVPWPQVATVLAVATLPTVVAVVRGAQHFDGAVLAWLVVAAAVGCYAFDEPARAVVDATPTALGRRVLARFVLVAGAAALCAVVVALLVASDGSAVPTARGQVAAAVAVLALSSAAAGVARRRGASTVTLGDVAVGPLAVLTLSGLAQRYAWLPTVTDERTAGRWWFVAGLGAAVAVWSVRDPYRRW